jgi:hypothetical protein
MIRSRLTYENPTEQVVALAWKGLQRAVVFYWQSLQTALNRSNPRPYKTPSKPGEPPRKRTGFLAANVRYEFNQPTGEARVGVTTNAKYGGFLEIGTRKMAARPWLLATLQKVFPQLQVLLKSEQ